MKCLREIIQEIIMELYSLSIPELEELNVMWQQELDWTGAKTELKELCAVMVATVIEQKTGTKK